MPIRTYITLLGSVLLLAAATVALLTPFPWLAPAALLLAGALRFWR